MSNTVLTSPASDSFQNLLVEVIYADLLDFLKSAEAGQCSRISTLPKEVMIRLCRQLREAKLNADIFVLDEEPKYAWQATSFKLIELRNAEEKPLLVFIPTGARTSANDSIDISTFLEVPLPEVLSKIKAKLIEQLRLVSPEAPEKVLNILQRVRELDSARKYLNPESEVRYYISTIANKGSDVALGGALYNLGLLPDFKLSQNSGKVASRIDLNIDTVVRIIDPRESLMVRLQNLKIKPNTAQKDFYELLRYAQSSDSRLWTTRIATETTWSHLGFDQLEWVGDGQESTNIQLYFTKHSVLPEQDKIPVLDLTKTQALTVYWSTNPPPVQCGNLDHFRIEFVSDHGAVVDLPGIVKKPKGRSKSSSKKLAKLDKLGLEEGAYFIRVRAYNSANQIINDEEPRTSGKEDEQKINESGQIWITTSTDPIDVLPKPSRNQIVPSYIHAWFEANLSRFLNSEDAALRIYKYQWETTDKKATSSEDLFTIQFDDRNMYSVAFSETLKQLEAATLLNSEELGRWFIDFTKSTTITRRQSRSDEATFAPKQFQNARQKLFKTIREGQKIEIYQDDAVIPVPYSGGHKEMLPALLTSLVDLTNYEDEILEYSNAYNQWLQSVYTTLQENKNDFAQLLKEDALLLDIDVVEVIIPVGLNASQSVLLVSPTHPLRMLWFLQFTKMVKTWLKQGITSTKETARRLLGENIKQLLNFGLLPNNFPPMLLHRQSGENKLFVDRGALGYFWQFYLPLDARDTQSLRTRLEQVLGLDRTESISATISKVELSRKLLRYLYQHPYVDTLRVNVFNPGDAKLLVDCMLELQKVYRDLKYQIRLFAEYTEGIEFGQAVDELVNPQHQVSDEQDEFGLISRNPLFPKVKYSRNTVNEYLKQPESFEAHISIFQNFFSVDINLSTEPPLNGSSYVYGLMQELQQVFSESDQNYLWRQALRPQACSEISTHPTSALIAELLQSLQTLQGIYAEGRVRESGEVVYPVIELELSEIDRRLLYLAHRYSDWVVTIDRNLGLEYFDSYTETVKSDQPTYLLDHNPEFVGNGGERLMLTTHSNLEIVRLIRPTLQTFQLPSGEGREELFLSALRSLSGRLVLKLLSSYNKREEILSLVLSQLFLKQYGLLQNRFVIPLDAHSELFASAQREDLLEKEISLKRTDLVLVEVNPEKRILHFRLVEVKARQALSASALLDLRQQMLEQVQNSQEVLRQHFDPSFTQPDRLDRPVKLKELIDLLSFYLGRGLRHKLLDSQYEAVVRQFIYSLDKNYNIEFEKQGLIFDFGLEGIKHYDNDPNLMVHHIGRDYIKKLIDNELELSSISEVRHPLFTLPMQSDSTFEEITTYFKPQTGNRLAQIIEERRKQAQPAIPKEVESEKPITPTTISSEPEKTVAIKPDPSQLKEAIIIMPEEGPAYNVLLGDTHFSPQYGILGKSGNRTIALDLNGCNTISLFGVQGGGKSYTLGTIVEMATRPLANINQLPSPLATVIFHYNESQDYAPEFVSMVEPNNRIAEVTRLADEYGAVPTALEDVLILTIPDKLEERQREFPTVKVEPIYFHSSELSIKDWKFLMSAVSNQAMYLQQMTYIMRQYRTELTLDNLRRGIEEADLSTTQRKLAKMRLDFASQFINDNYHLAEKLKPGRLIIVDVRDELIEQDEALGLFVVMLNIFANAGKNFNKLVVFDEAHKYMSNRDLTGHIVEVVRQMRHQGVSILIASQDPESLPEAIIELSSVTVLHRFNSPSWIKHIQKSLSALGDLTPSQLSSLATGEAYIWANKTTDSNYSARAVKIRCRPRLTLHGGSTKTALSNK